MSINLILLNSVALIIYTFLGAIATKIFIVLVFIFANFIEYFQDNFSIIINPNIIEGILDTSFSLAIEIVPIELILKTLGMSILIILALSMVKIKLRSFKEKLKYLSVYSLIVTILSLFIFITYFDIREKGAIRNQTISTFIIHNNPINILFAYRQHQIRNRFILNLDYTLDERHPFKLASHNNDLKVIIVIGEAARSDKFALNGYSRNTNPNLTYIDNIHSFTKATSCATSTTSGMLCIMDREQGTNKTLNIAYILKKLEFETNVYSLQNYGNIYASWGADNIITKYDFLSKSHKSNVYDDTLLKSLKENYKKTSQRQLFVLHTLGSHAVYTDRYPSDFNVFAPVCKSNQLHTCDLKHLHNAYDNSIIYTDYILSEIIKFIEKENAILFYISDHGESLGENGIFTHSMPEDSAPPEQFKIPFIIWRSEKFIQNNPGITDALNKNLNKNISQHNFFHSVLDCIGANNGEDVYTQLSVCNIQ